MKVIQVSMFGSEAEIAHPTPPPPACKPKNGEREMRTIKEIRARNPKWGTSKKHKAPPLLIQQEILRFQEYRCERCGCPLGPENTEFDHVVPYHIKPTHFFVAVCRPCNQEKGGRVIHD